MLEFAKLTREERKTVNQIAARAVALFRKGGVRLRKADVVMDLTAVHAKMPLRLADMLAADDFNLGHDVAGIWKHLNRRTGELEDFFVPRFFDEKAYARIQKAARAGRRAEGSPA
jgi:hypothetical protein